MTTGRTLEELEEMAAQVRRDIVRMVYQAGSGHPGGALGCTEFFVVMYFQLMKHDPSFAMKGHHEDVFYLSNGHISAVWYSILARSGYFPISELSTFRKLNSRLQGHPAVCEHLPGVRVASGSLGQGLSIAIGHAQAKKLLSDPQRVYVLMGDGEQQEGQIWEAAMYAAHHKVDNLVAVVDCNGQQIDGPVRKVMSMGSLMDKYNVFGWKVLEAEGNDLSSLLSSMQLAKSLTKREQPVAVMMKTEMGHGVDFMTNNHAWHGVAPNKEQYEKAMQQLRPTPHQDF